MISLALKPIAARQNAVYEVDKLSDLILFLGPSLGPTKLVADRRPSVTVHEDILRSIRDILGQALAQGCVTAKVLSKLLGKLIFATQCMKELKGFLQPLFALLKAFERAKRDGRLFSARISKDTATRRALSFWQEVLTRPPIRALPLAADPSGLSVVAASDGSTTHIAGWAATSKCGVWFRLKVSDESLGRWAYHLKEGTPCHKDISFLELLAAAALQLCYRLSESLEASGSRDPRIFLWCDNMSVVHILSKLYSPTSLSDVLRALAKWYGRVADKTLVAHIRSESNWLADALSRDAPVEFPPN
ncbi:hypothetical protein FOZ60_013463 [Perkinsus olseni]|uniref:Uncharacterized protein n=1 Tax=Perkinsus olseni TaxID=32597 RepID=A0A7J6N9H6_PEROL|nr:hypothetical protein FOZ60_013463 [Perkinsus olseni]